MRCFELRHHDLVEGLLINPGPDAPHINITSNGEFYFPLDEKLARFYLKQPKIAPIRMLRAEMAKDEQSLTVARQNDRTALLRLDLCGGQNGLVHITSSVYEEVVLKDRVEPVFRQFPPCGVRVVGEHADPTPWSIGSERLELAITMMPGSSFRIHRTGNLGNHKANSYVRWNGFKMFVTKPPVAKPGRDTGARQAAQ